MMCIRQVYKNYNINEKKKKNQNKYTLILVNKWSQKNDLLTKNNNTISSNIK